MATTVLTDVCFLVAEYDFTAEMNEVSLTQSVETPDATTFKSGNTRQYTPGLAGTAGVHHGWVNSDTGPPTFFGGDGTAWGLVGTQEAGNHTLLPEGGTTEGEVAYFFESSLTKYSESGSIGDLYGFDIEFSPRGDLIRGSLMNDAITLQTASFTGAKVQVGAQTAGTDTLYARIHVVEFSGTTLDIDVRSDTDAIAGGETIRLSFTQATGVTSENLTFTAGTTDTWWDVDFTFVGTNFRAIVVVGIQ
jgi:hypothetical protein